MFSMPLSWINKLTVVFRLIIIITILLSTVVNWPSGIPGQIVNSAMQLRICTGKNCKHRCTAYKGMSDRPFELVALQPVHQSTECSTTTEKLLFFESKFHDMVFPLEHKSRFYNSVLDVFECALRLIKSIMFS